MAKSDLKTFILVYNTLPIPLGAVSIKPSLPFIFILLFFFGGGGWFFFDGVKQLNDIDNMNDDDDHNETNNRIDHSFTRPKNHSLDSIIVTSKRALV